MKNFIFFSINKFYKKCCLVIILFSIMLLLFSCKGLKYDNPRIYKTKVVVKSGNVNKSNLGSYIRQKPNKKILFIIPFHMSMYNLASNMKDRSKAKEEKVEKKIDKLRANNKRVDFDKMERKKQRTLKNWLMETIGEAPVILDENATILTIKQMELYMKSIGHFYPKINSVVELNDKANKAKVTYNVYGGAPKIVKNIEWNIFDSNIIKFEEKIKKETLLKTQMQYDEDVFESERDRITEYLRNNGYYHFSKSFIVYEVDTTFENNFVDISLIIKPFLKKTDSDEDKRVEVNHLRSKIGNVFFNMNFSFEDNDIKKDTIKVEFANNRKDTNKLIYFFIYKEELQYKPKAILRKSFLRSGDFVKIENALKTNNAIASLSNFKYINIKFNEAGIDSLGFNILDVDIDLSRTKKQTFSAEFEGTNSSGNLGVAGGIVYRNRNLIKGAEVLSIKTKGSVEIQSLVGRNRNEDNIISSLPFNTVETSVDAGLSIPRFLMPYSDNFFTERNAPKTNISTGVFFQQRPDYTRYLGNLSITYEWKETANKLHQLTPVFFNLVRIFPDSLFSLRIEQLSRSLQTSYRDHLTSGARWTYYYTSRTSTKEKSYYLLRTNLEMVGNISRLFSKYFAKDLQGDKYYIFGIRFSQYAKGDVDIRKYYNFNEKNSLVFRYFMGLGVPYGNIEVLPFDKRFSAGGANDIRAWKYRSLGPGSYSDKESFDKTGDVSLIGNIEYRFPVYDILHSALFIDAGNVWTLKEYDGFENGQFDFNTFYKQIAVGVGLGFRLNFGFFIFRLDAGMPICDPARPENKRWLSFNRARKLTNLNFGIGYPF